MADEDRIFGLDKGQARRAFELAAGSYDEAAVVQGEVGDQLLERLDYIKLEPTTLLDLGCGTGRLTGRLLERYRKARVIAVDVALAMTRRAARVGRWRRRPRPLCADMERLPLATDSVDMVFSSLTLQWAVSLDEAFAEVSRVLRPGGLFMFTTFGPDTLRELRRAWAAVDGYNHVNAFTDMHDVGDGLMRAGFAEPVMDVEYLTVTYEHVRALMGDLKAIGAHNVTAGRPRGMTGKGRLRALVEAYDAFRTDEGRLPATYEVVYGHAWGGARRAAAAGPGNVVHFPVDRLKGVGGPGEEGGGGR